MSKDSGGGSGLHNYWSILDNEGKSNLPNKRKKTASTPTNKNSNNMLSLQNFPFLGKSGEFDFKLNEHSKYLVMKSKEPGTSLKNINIFKLHKAIQNISQDFQNISFTAQGHLLILTKTNRQTQALLKTTKLNINIEVECFEHPTLNSTKGVVYSNFLTDLDHEEIVEELSNQNVIKCDKITRSVNGKTVNTPLHILTFNCLTLPKNLKVGFLNLPVKPYVPKPMQCKNCHKFGHTKNRCTNTTTCLACSAPEHHPKICEKVECINCHGQHTSTNPKCPVYIKRQEIIEYKIINKCTYSYAAEFINNKYNKQNINRPSPTETMVEASKIKEIKLSNRTTLSNNPTQQINTKTDLPSSYNTTQSIATQNSISQNPATP